MRLQAGQQADREDTICAISTPPGVAGIGVIRISGNGAFAVVQPLFRGKGALEKFPSHTAHYGEVLDPFEEKVVDQALFLVMKGPRTYTSEDLIEIQSHGNPFILQKILSLLLRQGARLATPGEFTRRAFLSGRIDLAQAEAVMELISSQHAGRHQWALSQLKGQLSRKIDRLRERLLSILAQIEASIDFSEEGLTFWTTNQVGEEIGAILAEVQGLLAGYEEGRQIRDGSTMVIIGRPNVGKSSLMNLLLGEDRAIVTPFPGTTRDLLQEWVQIEGMSVRVIDTAGYRRTTDPIESEGVRRGEEALMKGDLALWVLDASEPLQQEDYLLLERIKCDKKIAVLNKSDLPRRIDIGPISGQFPSDRVVSLSALTGEGTSSLKKIIKALLLCQPEMERPLVALVRHRNALKEAEKALDHAMVSVREGLSWEFLAVDLRESADALGEIIGKTTTDEILNQIFNQFCIGK